MLFLSVFPLAGLCAEEKKQTVREYLEERGTLYGYAQAGAHYETVDRKSGGPQNAMAVHRAILVAGLDPLDHVHVMFMADIANFRLHEYYVEYKPFRQFSVRFGQFKTPFSIENGRSPSVNEVIRGSQSVQYLAGIDGSDVCFSGGAGRDVGIEARGHLFPLGDGHELLYYRLGVFNGEPYNHKESNTFKDLSAMLSLSPFKWASLVGSVYYGHATAYADNLYGAFSAGDIYKRERWSAGLELERGAIYLRSEYLQGNDGGIPSRGAYMTVKAGVLKWLDVIASVDYFDRNVSVDDWQCNYIAGLQWNFGKRCRLQFQYAFEQRNLMESSHLLITQLQVGF